MHQRIVVEVVFQDHPSSHYLPDIEETLKTIVALSGVLSAAVMEYDGMGGYDVDESTRIVKRGATK